MYYETSKTPQKSLAESIWKFLTNPWCLAIATILILFIMLGTKLIWTQEWRWANISQQMLIRHDFLHPYLAQLPYYDKPLLSYWLVILSSFVTLGLNVWALRLPSVLAGLITVWCTYCLGKRILNKETGLLAAWLLISTFCFVFWARTASADMLDVAGIMLALTWYFTRCLNRNFMTYFVFFLILAVAALCKGLIAPVIVFIAIIPDLLHENNWIKHLNLSCFITFILGVLIYLTPFLLSAYFSTTNYNENGLTLVFQENFVRYFWPFDHPGSLYTYLIYLPVYTFPWVLLYIPALLDTFWHWRSKNTGVRWLLWANILIFIFLMASGSRRDYYILPMVPFVMLLTASWICSTLETFDFRKKLASYLAGSFYIIILLIFGLVFPIAYSGGGVNVFAQLVRQQATQMKPWKDWQISMLDAQNKASFYLHSPNLINFIDAKTDTKDNPSRNGLMLSFPILFNNPDNNILILRVSYLPYIKDITQKYIVVQTPPTFFDKLSKTQDPSAPVALIPQIGKTTTRAPQEITPPVSQEKIPTPQEKISSAPTTEPIKKEKVLDNTKQPTDIKK